MVLILPFSHGTRLHPAPAAEVSQPRLARYDADLSGGNVDTEIIKALASGRLPPSSDHHALPRLRFDRVAQRLIRDLQDALGGAVLEERAVIITVTAPIRSPARTVAAVITRVREALCEGGNRRDLNETICGNGVHVRIVRNNFPDVARVIVFVCNPDPPAIGLLDLAERLLSYRPLCT